MIELVFFEEIIQIRMCRVIDGNPLYWVAAYLVDGLLIDTGCSYTVGELVDFLEKYPAEMVVNTHYHEDHIGANRSIQERYGIPVYAHPASIPLIGRRATLYPYQEFTWGYPEPSHVLPIPSIINTKHFTFEVIEVPGHSQDHIALIEQSRGWCFTGDTVVGPRVKTLRPEEDMKTTIASHRKLAALKAERLILLTSSGKIFADGRKILSDFAHFISEISGKAQNLYNSGQSVAEIVIALFGGEDPRSVWTNDQFSSANLIRSILKLNQ